MVTLTSRIHALSALVVLLLALCATPSSASGHLHQHRDRKYAPDLIPRQPMQPHAERYRQAVTAALDAKKASKDFKRGLHKKRGPQTPMQLCPGKLQACTLPSGSYECLDTTQELNACGACLEEGGMDCEAIPNVELVTCALSRCEIHACKPGFRPSMDKTSCVKQATKRSRTSRQ